MDLQLEGKTALVSGSTAGIGLAIATALAKEGVQVIVNGRKQARVDQAMKASGAAHGIAADLGTEEGARTVITRFPTVDILVNNLGIFEPKPFEAITDDDWRRFFEINVLSGVRLSRHYIGAMMQRNWGRIIFISSESGLQIPVEMIHYGMTKTAQLAVSRGLAETTAGTAVTVNAVLPGPTKSEGVIDFVDRLAAEKKVGTQELEREFFRTARPSSIIQRFATPEEVASVVTFVCSPLAAAINGASVRAEGGVIRSIA
ncbi:MAG TPA: SDR family oxidoreductase [Bryobacteraceae bacterium]|nr:SDR family oxidoreductase [Bryobacteraceae bacterium]